MESILGRRTKQSDETRDYDLSYEDWFANRADTPVSHATTVEPGLTLISSTLTGEVVKVILSGGTSGEQYKVTVLLTTSSGVVREGDFVVRVKDV